MDKLAEKVGEWLPTMAAKLGVAAEHVYSALVTYYTWLLFGGFIAAAATMLLFGVFAIVLLRLALVERPRHSSYDPNPHTIFFWAAFGVTTFVAVIGFINAIFDLPYVLAALASPEGYALTQILKAVK